MLDIRVISESHPHLGHGGLDAPLLLHRLGRFRSDNFFKLFILLIRLVQSLLAGQKLKLELIDLLLHSLSRLLRLNGVKSSLIIVERFTLHFRVDCEL
jgi:hypothetical protein